MTSSLKCFGLLFALSSTPFSSLLTAMQKSSLSTCSFFSSVQFSRSVVSNSENPWIAARQASLSPTNSRSSLRLKSTDSVMPSSHLILCHPLLLLPSISPSIRVFSMSQLFAWGGQSTGVSPLASFLPRNTQDWSPKDAHIFIIFLNFLHFDFVLFYFLWLVTGYKHINICSEL